MPLSYWRLCRIALAAASVVGLTALAGGLHAQSKKSAPAPPPADEAERQRVNARLLETAALIQKSEGELSTVEAKLSRLEVDEGQKRASLNGRRDQIAKLLSALLRMGRNPPPVMITKREDALEMVRSAMLLSAAFPALSKDALSLARELTDLAALMDGVRAERDRIKTQTQQLEAERTRLASLVAAKQQALRNWQPELAAVSTEVATVSKTVGDPDQLIAEGDKVVTGKTGLGAYQEERKAAALAGPIQVAPDGAVAGNPDSDIAPFVPPSSGGVVELAPASTRFAALSPSRMKPAIPFQLAKAKLPMPAFGQKVLGFGDKTKFGAQSKGIVLETRALAQITSPCDGWIVYSGEFRSYGQLLIINAGDGYHVLLAGLSQVDVQPGRFVLAGEPVGTMGGSSAQSGAKSAARVLYVEFRKDNRPVDPDPWWVQKVQG